MLVFVRDLFVSTDGVNTIYRTVIKFYNFICIGNGMEYSKLD